MPFRKAATERSVGERGKKGERKEERGKKERREGGRKEQKKNNKEKFETSGQRLVPGKPWKPGFVLIMSQDNMAQCLVSFPQRQGLPPVPSICSRDGMSD